MAFQLTKIVTDLHALGFSEKEIALYLVLKRLGPSQVNDIADNIRFSKPVTSKLLGSLSKKGLVSQAIIKRKNTYTAEVPERIGSIIEQKQWNVEQAKSQIGSVISTLDEFFPLEDFSSDTEVEYIEGKGKVGDLYKNILQEDEIMAFFDPRRVIKAFPEMPKEFSSTLKNKKTRIREIIVSSKIAKSYVDGMTTPNFEYKFISAKKKISCEVFIVSTGMIFITLKEKPTAVIVRNSRLAKSGKMLFNLAWSAI